MTSPLDDARARLDALDRAMLDLLAERTRITDALREWKLAHALPLRDRDRERAMLDARRVLATELGVSPWLAEAVTRAVLASVRGYTDDERAFFTGSDLPAAHGEHRAREVLDGARRVARDEEVVFDADAAEGRERVDE